MPFGFVPSDAAMVLPWFSGVLVVSYPDHMQGGLGVTRPI